MASPPKVIVFGPTGAVGSAAARTAHDLGAHVTLAMRDTAKAIPKLPNTSTGNYTKVQADLTQPETVVAAVKQSGAKHAFIYMVHQSQDHMKATIQALKDAGIELVVFLSSFTVSGDLKAIKQEDIIDYVHAQVELNLEEVFGKEGYVAIRPGSFASNEMQYAPYFKKNETVKITFPKSRIDCIVPEDIGRVSGTVLAQGVPSDGNRAIYLYGPQFIKARESVATIAKVLGQDPTIEECDEEQARKVLTEERGYPAMFADYFVKHANAGSGGSDELFGRGIDGGDKGNVEKYGGGARATTFEEFVREERGKFEA